MRGRGRRGCLTQTGPEGGVERPGGLLEWQCEGSGERRSGKHFCGCCRIFGRLVILYLFFRIGKDKTNVAMDVVDSSCISPNLRPREIPVDPDVVRHVMWLVPTFSMAIETDRLVPKLQERNRIEDWLSEKIQQNACIKLGLLYTKFSCLEE